MNEIGQWSLRTAFLVGAVAAGLLTAGAWRARPTLLRLGRPAAIAWFALIAVAALALAWAFLNDDFSLRYVADRSRTDQPLHYKLGAFWAGQEGSLLLWLLIMSGYAAYVARQATADPVRPLANGLLISLALFFHALVVFVADPFARLPAPPVEGRGLNPLLQDPYMLAHPVFLYLGYIGFSVPFSFAAASLLLRRGSDEWIRVTRRWSVTAWMFLSTGILLGSAWAYHVLGWGGYWGWDPVENASFIPWLTATAFIHSAMVQERRGMLKAWNFGLIAGTFLLTIFGTFLVRSGILASVHAFAESDVGPWFMAFLSALISGALALALARAEQLRDERQIESPLSRETGFLANNVVLVAAAAAVLFGTALPLLSRLFGNEITVGAPYFNRVTTPLFLILVLLMGIGPVLAWRRSTWATLRQRFLGPIAGALLAAAGLALAGVRSPVALIGFASCLFVAWTIVAEFAHGARARAELTGEPLGRALWGLLQRNPRRYGGYIVHLAVVCMVIGIVASSVYQLEVTRSLPRGGALRIGPYELVYHGLEQSQEGSVRIVSADLELRRGGQALGRLTPEKRFYPGWSEMQGPITPSYVRSIGLEDVYVLLGGWERGGEIAAFQVFVNPLVPLLWAGGLLLIAGTAFAVWPRATVRAAAPAREAAVLRDLADLEYDFRLGKISAAEYQAARAGLAGEAAAQLRRRQAAEAAVLAELRAELRAGAGD